jgi:hypothetical protein
MFTHPNHLLQKKLTDYKIIMRNDFADLENEVSKCISHLSLFATINSMISTRILYYSDKFLLLF